MFKYLLVLTDNEFMRIIKIILCFQLITSTANAISMARLSCFTQDVRGEVGIELSFNSNHLSREQRDLNQSLNKVMSYKEYPVQNFQIVRLGDHLFRVGIEMLTKPFSNNIPIAAFSIVQEYENGLKLIDYRAVEFSKLTAVRIETFDKKSQTHLRCIGTKVRNLSKNKSIMRKKQRIPAKTPSKE